MERKFRDITFWKIEFIPLDCPVFQTIWKMLFLSPLEMFGNANRNFRSNGMHAGTPLYIS